MWGGLLLTVLLAVVGIVLSFPLGVILALGRRSELPVLRILSTGYIELIRGVPLVTILFMADIILPLFLPGEWRLDRIARAMGGITLFSAAYVAENVRGGLQAIPTGQIEAAHALGLGGVQTNRYIVLPQALRAVIPANVGLFISLLKDTTLVTIIGLLELLGISRAVLAQSDSFGASLEVYVFIAAVFFVLSLRHVPGQLSARTRPRRGHALMTQSSAPDRGDPMTDQPATSAETNADDIIIARDVHKWFGELHVLKGINLTVKTGEVVVVFGASGSGKSTFIRTINRLEQHQRGEIIVDGIAMTNDIRNIAAIRSEIGMVFQSFNLFPHLTALENITLAPRKVKKYARAEADAIGMKLLERVGIPEQAHKHPAQLSGRPAAARGDRPRPGHEPEDHALRRADLRARPRDDQRGARRHAVAGPRYRHDDDRGDPRDGLRARRGQPDGLLRPRRDRGDRNAEADLRGARAGANEAVPVPDPALRRARAHANLGKSMTQV